MQINQGYDVQPISFSDISCQLINQGERKEPASEFLNNTWDNYFEK